MFIAAFGAAGGVSRAAIAILLASRVGFRRETELRWDQSPGAVDVLRGVLCG